MYKLYLYKTYDDILNTINSVFLTSVCVHGFIGVEVTDMSIKLKEYDENRCWNTICYSDNWFPWRYVRLSKYKSELKLIQKYMNNSESI